MPRTLVVGLVLLAIVSAVLAVLVPRWQVVPGLVIADPGFATLGGENGAAWQRLGAGRIEPVAGGVRLVNDDPDEVVGLDQLIRIPFGVQAFRMTALVVLRGVAVGTEPWHKPRLVVQGMPADGQVTFAGRFQLIDRGGDVGPVRLSAVFPVASPSDEALVMLRLYKATGEMEIRDLVVEAAVKPPARELLRRVLITVWLGIGAGIGLVLWWRSENRLAASLVLGGLGLLASMVVLPQALRQPLHDLLAALAGDRWLDALKPLLHVAAFGVLAFAARLALPSWPLRLHVLGWLAAALLLELAELYFSLFDLDDLVDMVVNATGAMVGLAAAAWLIRRPRQQHWWPRGRTSSPDPAAGPGLMRRP